MEKQLISLSLISDYVSKEETGYQVCNEIVNIARGNDDINTEFLLKEIKNSNKAFLVKEKDELLGFEDIFAWKEPSDTLVLLDTNVMLLFPKHKDPSYPTFSKLINRQNTH